MGGIVVSHLIIDLDKKKMKKTKCSSALPHYGPHDSNIIHLLFCIYPSKTYFFVPSQLERSQTKM